MTRKEAEKAFLQLLEQCGLSPENPEDMLKLAFVLFMERLPTPKPKRKGGRKATTDSVAEDAILYCAVKVARMKGVRGDRKIIRDIAKWNGWPTTASAIETKRRRFMELTQHEPKPKGKPKPQSRRYKRLIEALRADRDKIERFIATRSATKH